MNNTDQNPIEKNNRVLIEVPSWIKDDAVRWIYNNMSTVDNLYDLGSVDRDVKLIPNTYNFDILNRFNFLCERESKDNIIDYKTIKKHKGLYDIRSLDFKILDASELDSLNLFYINGRLCGWKTTKNGIGKEIAEIKSEEDLMDYNKYDKKFKTVRIIIQGFFTIIAVLACIINWIK